MREILDDIDGSMNESSRTSELAQYVGSKKDYYLQKWDKIEKGNWLSFNLGACFVGAGWMLYRKMYLEASILILLIIVESHITTNFLYQYFNDTNILDLGIQLIYTFGTGFFSNYLYLKSAERSIVKLKNLNLEEADYQEKLAKTGGTSWNAVIIGLILYFVLIYFTMPTF